MAITRKTFIDPPVLRKSLAFVLLVVNVFFPGLGTVIAGFLTCKLKSMFTGILQLVTAPLVVGWAWSVIWGWELWTQARRHPSHLFLTLKSCPSALAVIPVLRFFAIIPVLREFLQTVR